MKPQPVNDYPAMRIYVAINYACAIFIGVLGIVAALISAFSGNPAAALIPIIFSVPVVLLLMLSAEMIKIIIDIKHDLGGIAHVLYEQHLQRLKEAALSNPPVPKVPSKPRTEAPTITVDTSGKATCRNCNVDAVETLEMGVAVFTCPNCGRSKRK